MNQAISTALAWQGTILAARLYRDVVIRNRIAEDPAIPLASLPDSSAVAAPNAAGKLYQPPHK